MANSIWQATAQNATGDIIPGAEVTVVNEATGLSATIYSDIGGTALANPFFADSDGFIQFYAAAGTYRVTAEDGGTGLSQTWRYIRLGDAASRDTGTSAGNLPTADDLSMIAATKNFTDNNLTPDVFAGAIAFAKSSTELRMLLPTINQGRVASITVTGTFQLFNLSASSFQTVNNTDITLNSSSSDLGCTHTEIGGMTGLNVNQAYFLRGNSAGAQIKSNF
jgi:hypothetical protein